MSEQGDPTGQPTPELINEIKAKFENALTEHWKWFLGQGIFLVVLGLLAVALPNFSTLAVELTVGWLFVFGGAGRLAVVWRARGTPGFIWALIAGIAAIVVGLLLIARPLQGTLTLTMVLMAFFIVQGVASVLIALEYRQKLPNWIWTLLSGLVDIFLAYLIWQGWPGTATWAIGLLVGINMAFLGFSLISLALAARGGGKPS